MHERRCDVAVIGAGPAGAIAALTAARLGVRVELLEASRYDQFRVGETLSPAAGQVLRRLKLPWDLVSAAATPSFGNRSIWGDAEERSSSFIFNPFGDGWHIDRTRFDALLAKTAARAGARLRLGVKVLAGTERDDGDWELRLQGPEAAPVGLRARAVLLATGRRAVLARAWGARVTRDDRLVAIIARFPIADGAAGYTSVEAVRDGWWYVAALPQGDAVVVFICDADICHAKSYAQREVFERALGATTSTQARLADRRLTNDPVVCSAASHLLRRPNQAARWMACGDAAIAVDPLSASGLLRSFRTGEAAGFAVVERLGGNDGPARLYDALLEEEYNAYLMERRENYRQEQRWPDAPFWRRRHRGNDATNREAQDERTGQQIPL